MKKYRPGKRIRSVSDFEKTKCNMFIVFCGMKAYARNRAFLISWQYQYLQKMIYGEHVYEAELITEEENP